MAIAPTGAIYKALSFDNTSSRNYGVYITGQAVYNAPERDVEMISIPGRNGAFALDNGRFENIEVTYPAGLFADKEIDFAQAISDFRNFLCSRKGYVRLTDEYNPNEYRLAIYKSGLEVSPVQLKAGEFEITFECKPQRFLISGDEPITVSSGSTITNPTLFDAQPMLEVEGYGTIAFNGFEIEIENATMGEVVIADPSTYASKSYFGISFRKAQFNNGDTITLNGASCKWYQDTSGAVLSSITSLSHSNSNFSTSYTGTASSTNPATTTVGPINFVAGTDSTITDTMTLVGARNGATLTLIVKTEISYTYDWTTGSSRIYFSTYKSSSTTDSIYYHVNSVSHSGAKGDSSLSILGHPTYIDCELGEVYMIKDGTPISLNQYIDLGSELPTLGVGANEITYDNTVTDLKVIPRWWKV